MEVTRKEFLKYSGIAGAWGLAGFPGLSRPVANGNTVFEQQPTVTIRSIKPYLMPKSSALFVRVESSEGITGWGECNAKYTEIILPMVELLAERCIGESIWDTEYLWNLLYFKEVDAGQNAFLGGAISGIDAALWDLKGKLLDQPVYSILGGPYTSKIQVYGSYGRGSRNPKTTQEMVSRAVQFVEKGYKAIKVRMQIRQLNRDPRPDPSFEVIREVRKAIGDDITLFFDANNGYSPYRAIQVGKELYERYNIASFEEPVAEYNYDGLSQVVQALDVPVTAGEHEFNRWQFRDLILMGKVDILNPDIAKSGGIAEALKIATLASTFDRQIMCHNVRPTLASTAAFQLVMSIHNAAPFQEFGGTREDIGLQQYFGQNLTFKDGYIEVPNGPGWGMHPDEKRIEKSKIN